MRYYIYRGRKSRFEQKVYNIFDTITATDSLCDTKNQNRGWNMFLLPETVETIQLKYYAHFFKYILSKME